MRLVTLTRAGRAQPGLLIGDEVLDIAAAGAILSEAKHVAPSVRGILEGGGPALDWLRRVEEKSRALGTAQALRELRALSQRSRVALDAPVPDPGVILSAGMNYHAHLKEMNTPAPAKPTAFFKNPSAITGPGRPVLLPPGHSDMVDWEGEFSAVIGKPCYNVSAEDALDYVAGYTLINDISARDWVAPVFQSAGIMGPIQAWERNILGKQFPTFCPMGPVIVTKDELPDPGNVALTTSLNGQAMQVANTSDLVFGVAQLIGHFSQFMKLRPGDVITTGSPAGVGYGRSPKVFMKAGDTIEVNAEGIGVLASPVKAG